MLARAVAASRAGRLRVYKEATLPAGSRLSLRATLGGYQAGMTQTQMATREGRLGGGHASGLRRQRGAELRRFCPQRDVPHVESSAASAAAAWPRTDRRERCAAAAPAQRGQGWSVLRCDSASSLKSDWGTGPRPRSAAERYLMCNIRHSVSERWGREHDHLCKFR